VGKKHQSKFFSLSTDEYTVHKTVTKIHKLAIEKEVGFFFFSIF